MPSAKAVPRDQFLVVRCSFIDGVDPIEEINRVIERKGHAWFGKYGGPLARSLGETVRDPNVNTFVVLVQKDTGANYAARPFRLLEVTKNRPKRRDHYPRYYDKVIGRIGDWLKVAPYDGPTFDIRKLQIRSSAQPLLRTLGLSMRGYFLCRL